MRFFDMPQYMPLRHLISSALGFAPGVTKRDNVANELFAADENEGGHQPKKPHKSPFHHFESRPLPSET